MRTTARPLNLIASLAAVALLAGLPCLPSASAQDAASAATPSTQPTSKASITVTVTDKDNKPVEGAGVSLMARPAKGEHNAAADSGTPRPKPQPLATGTTDSDGKVTLADIGDGTYVVVARLKHTGNGRAKVTVTDGASSEVAVVLQPGGGRHHGASAGNAPTTQPGASS